MNNSPYKPTWLQIFGKLIVWLITGLFIAFLVFILLMLIGDLITNSISSKWTTGSINPIVWLLLIAIAFLATVIWNLILWWVYNIIWPEKYYDFKLFSVSTVVLNMLLFVIFFILYFYVWQVLQNIYYLFNLFAFHLFISIFLSNTVWEFTTNPNYGAVYIIGWTIWLSFSILFFIVVLNMYSTLTNEAQQYIIMYPPIISFSFIPFFSTVWERIYYNFYDMGNNFLYVPSIEEVLVEEEENDDVNVEV